MVPVARAPGIFLYIVMCPFSQTLRGCCICVEALSVKAAHWAPSSQLLTQVCASRYCQWTGEHVQFGILWVRPKR